MPKVYAYTAFGGPENQHFLELPIPTPNADELLVAVRAASVNPGDWKHRANRDGARTMEGPEPKGLEVSGIVAEVGRGVGGFVVGDAVLGYVERNGGLSEFAVVGAERAHKPETLSFVDAATLPVAAAAAYDAVEQLHLTVGDTLLITGIGGGVGTFAAQLAVSAGARVLGTAGAEKASFVQSLGAESVVYGVGAAERVAAAAPEGLSAILDLVGGEALRALGPLIGSHTRIIAVANGTAAAEFGGPRVARKHNAAVLEAVVDLVATGQLTPHVTAVFPYERVADAIALVESGHASGKVVVEISSGTE